MNASERKMIPTEIHLAYPGIWYFSDHNVGLVITYGSERTNRDGLSSQLGQRRQYLNGKLC